eukprot:57684-Hanusia_phi.AAC.4
MNRSLPRHVADDQDSYRDAISTLISCTCRKLTDSKLTSAMLYAFSMSRFSADFDTPRTS